MMEQMRSDARVSHVGFHFSVGCGKCTCERVPLYIVIPRAFRELRARRLKADYRLVYYMIKQLVRESCAGPLRRSASDILRGFANVSDEAAG